MRPKVERTTWDFVLASNQSVQNDIEKARASVSIYDKFVEAGGLAEGSLRVRISESSVSRSSVRAKL